jgi:hypothetical protein
VAAGEGDRPPVRAAPTGGPDRAVLLRSAKDGETSAAGGLRYAHPCRHEVQASLSDYDETFGVADAACYRDGRAITSR